MGKKCAILFVRPNDLVKFDRIYQTYCNGSRKSLNYKWNVFTQHPTIVWSHLPHHATAATAAVTAVINRYFSTTDRFYRRFYSSLRYCATTINMYTNSPLLRFGVGETWENINLHTPYSSSIFSFAHKFYLRLQRAAENLQPTIWN